MPTPILFRLQGVMGHAGRSRLGVSPFSAAHGPPKGPPLFISGVSRDSAGAALPGCECVLLCRTLFGTVNSTEERYREIDRMTSDGSGAYSFIVGPGSCYRVIFYLAGAPDRAGTTDTDLQGA